MKKDIKSFVSAYAKARNIKFDEALDALVGTARGRLQAVSKYAKTQAKVAKKTPKKNAKKAVKKPAKPSVKKSAAKKTAKSKPQVAPAVSLAN